MEATATAAAPDTQLWAVHVQGPDDVLPARNREKAGEVAADINAFWAKYREAYPDETGMAPDLLASVIAWDGAAEAHAAEVERLERDGYDL